MFFAMTCLPVLFFEHCFYLCQFQSCLLSLDNGFSSTISPLNRESSRKTTQGIMVSIYENRLAFQNQNFNILGILDPVQYKLIVKLLHRGTYISADSSYLQNELCVPFASVVKRKTALTNICICFHVLRIDNLLLECRAFYTYCHVVALSCQKRKIEKLEGSL